MNPITFFELLLIAEYIRNKEFEIWLVIVIFTILEVFNGVLTLLSLYIKAKYLN